MWQRNRYGEGRAFEGAEDIGLKVYIGVMHLLLVLFSENVLKCLSIYKQWGAIFVWQFCYCALGDGRLCLKNNFSYVTISCVSSSHSEPENKPSLPNRQNVEEY